MSIQDRLAYLKRILIITKEYYESAKMFITGINPDDNDLIESAITRTENLLNFDFSKVDSLESYHTIYELLQQSTADIRKLINTCNNSQYNKVLITDMSAGAYMDLRTRVESLKSLQQSYLNRSAADDPVILDDAVSELSISSEGNNQTTLNQTTLNQMYQFALTASANKFTNRIIMHLNQNNYRNEEINARVEEQKNIILGATRVYVDFPIVRYNLIFDQFIDDFDQYVKDNTSVVLIKHTNDNPLHYDIKGIINAAYVATNNLQINQSAGMNKKFIQRFNNIKVLDRVGTEYSIEIYLNGTVVVDAFNVDSTNIKVVSKIGNSYRICRHNQLQPTNLQPTNLQPTHLHPTNLTGLITGVSTRASEYARALNTIIVDAATQNKYDGMFNPNSGLFQAQYLDDVGVIASSDNIKNKLIDLIIPKLSINVHSYRDMVNQLNEKKEFIEDKVSEVMNDTINTASIEYQITQYVRVRETMTAFISKIQYQARNDYIPEKYFKDKPPDVVEAEITRVYRSILQKAADMLDANNMWTGYDYTYKEFLINIKKF